MANQHTVLAARQSVTSQRIPTEREILELAEMTSAVFDSPEAVGLKERLKEQVEAYRNLLRHQQRLTDDAYTASLGTDEQGRRRVAYGIGTQRTHPGPESLTFLLALLLTCPQLLLRPAGFEWVLQDLIQVLVARRLDPDSDRIFEQAMNKARIRSRVGPPKDKALEYFRYQTITELMHPTVVIPGVTAKLNKTKAVEFVAGMEVRLVNGKGGTRSIWTAHKRVKRFVQHLSECVQATPALVHPPSTNLAREPRERAEEPKKGINRSKHPKRRRPK
jgi:hypothetical protein